MCPMQRRGLRKVARLLGGPERLAWHLDVSAEELACWMDGTRAAPQAVMMAVIELLSLMETGADISTTSAAPAPSLR